jgi:hypothetical protein
MMRAATISAAAALTMFDGDAPGHIPYSRAPNGFNGILFSPSLAAHRKTVERWSSTTCQFYGIGRLAGR